DGGPGRIARPNNNTAPPLACRPKQLVPSRDHSTGGCCVVVKVHAGSRGKTLHVARNRLSRGRSGAATCSACPGALLLLSFKIQDGRQPAICSAAFSCLPRLLPSSRSARREWLQRHYVLAPASAYCEKHSPPECERPYTPVR